MRSLIPFIFSLEHKLLLTQHRRFPFLWLDPSSKQASDTHVTQPHHMCITSHTYLTNTFLTHTHTVTHAHTHTHIGTNHTHALYYVTKTNKYTFHGILFCLLSLQRAWSNIIIYQLVYHWLCVSCISSNSSNNSIGLHRPHTYFVIISPMPYVQLDFSFALCNSLHHIPSDPNLTVSF